MKIKYIFTLLLFFFFTTLIFAGEENDVKNNENNIQESISETNIKIGQKIILTLKIKNLSDVKILWEDISISHTEAQVLEKKDFYKNKKLIFEIVFTFFKSGDFNDFNITIPISTNEGEMLYLETDKYNIFVESPLTEEEIENLKSIQDPSKIELKKEKEQAKIPFQFSPFLKIIIFLLIIIIISMILYFYVYKKLFKKIEDSEIQQMPPFEKFIANIARLLFDIKDSRETVEQKLSELTEILKELIYGEFSFNASVETTKELTSSLKDIDMDQELIQKTNKTLNELDLIKFAKAPFQYDNLTVYADTVKNLGIKIHEYKKSLLLIEENDENLQAG